jgi:hypothetical protein
MMGGAGCCEGPCFRGGRQVVGGKGQDGLWTHERWVVMRPVFTEIGVLDAWVYERVDVWVVRLKPGVVRGGVAVAAAVVLGGGGDGGGVIEVGSEKTKPFARLAAKTSAVAQSIGV